MLQRSFIKFDKTVFLPKKLLQKCLDNVYRCTQNASPKSRIWIVDKRSFIINPYQKSL